VAPTYAEYAAVEARLAADPTIRVPTLVLRGGGDPCNDPSTSENKEHFFALRYQRIVLDGVGHFLQRESPQAVAAAIVRFIGPILVGDDSK
jgi:pimeloyl-ACP methyl ester carboxylesterase